MHDCCVNSIMQPFDYNIMWIRRVFGKGEDKLQPQCDLQEDGQEQDSMGSLLIDLTPDMCYVDEGISHKQLKVPLTLLHKNEYILMNEEGIFQGRSIHNSNWANIMIILSDRQMIISPNIINCYNNTKNISMAIDNYRVSYGMIEKTQLIEIKRQSMKIKIYMKDNSCILLSSIMGDMIRKVQQIMKKWVFVNGINKLYAFRFGKSGYQSNVNGWAIYQYRKEMMRQGAHIFITKEGGQAKPYKYVNNCSGQVCMTYPLQIVLPYAMSQNDIFKCSKFRTKQRLPSLTYFHQYSSNQYSSLFRCSQNRVGVMSTRCQQDQKMIQCISNAAFICSGIQSSGKAHNVKIYDARGYYAALGNMLSGKGYQRQDYYSCSLSFLNIPNIHAVRDSYNKIKSYNPYQNDLIKVIADSQWYDYLAKILHGAQSIAYDLNQGINVVVHCSDGWDRTSQLCSLAQLLLDPYYRTIQGLIVLIQKDWRHFGHKFRQRTGQYHSTKYNIYQKSPIFIQFLDCIYQIMNQFPLNFEYNSKLLSFLAQEVNSCTYGTFLVNSLQQGISVKIEQSTISIWSYIMDQIDSFRNPFFNRNSGSSYLRFNNQGINCSIWKQHLIGKAAVSNIQEFVMRQQKEINRTLKEQFYVNQETINKLEKQLKLNN